MDEIQVFARRGGKEIISQLKLTIGEQSLLLPVLEIDSQYNIRYVFEVKGESSTFSESVFGNIIEKAHYQDIMLASDVSSVSLKSSDDFLDISTKLALVKGNLSIDVKIFQDKPVHQYGILDTLPIPIEIVTLYITFKQDSNSSKKETIEKYFDGYSHLGFALVDIEGLKKILFEEYGNKTLDLIHEFSTTEIVDKLFDAGVLVITWGINPYTYPLYSSLKSAKLEVLLGEPFDQKGVYYISEDIKELSIIPGHDLREWPSLLEKDFPKITLFGEGKSVILQPYGIEDDEFEKVISSFFIYREKEEHNIVPLLNIDLLY